MKENLRYSVKRWGKDGMMLYQHINYEDKLGFCRAIFKMTMKDIESLFTDIESLFTDIYSGEQKEFINEGDPTCKHVVTPFKYNKDYEICSNCGTIMRIHKLIPRKGNNG